MEQRCGPVIFFSNFDSGNLARAELVEPVEDPESEAKNGKDDGQQKLVCDYEFNVWTKPDCMGTEFVNGNRTWFYFGIKAVPSGKVIRINIMNLNRQTRLYSQGMVPIVKVSYGIRETQWERLRGRVAYQTLEKNFILSFNYKFPESRIAAVYFAFCFPFSYTNCQEMLARLQAKHSTIPAEKPLEDAIYFHRELLCYSLESRRVDLLTITSCAGITSEREDCILGLFPDTKSDRARRFQGKKVFFLTARVHPGETPSSFVFNGFLNFILKENDPRARALRHLFVFKLVPMINPDGVYNGFYRTDTRGVNLNRVYLNPDPDLHPSVYAIRNLILYHHEKEHGRQTEEHRISNFSSKSSILSYGNGGALEQLSVQNEGFAQPLPGVTGVDDEQLKPVINSLSCIGTNELLSQQVDVKEDNFCNGEKYTTGLPIGSKDGRNFDIVNYETTVTNVNTTRDVLSSECNTLEISQPNSESMASLVAVQIQPESLDAGLMHALASNGGTQLSSTNEDEVARSEDERQSAFSAEEDRQCNDTDRPVTDSCLRASPSFCDGTDRIVSVVDSPVADKVGRIDSLENVDCQYGNTQSSKGRESVRPKAEEANGSSAVEDSCAAKFTAQLPKSLCKALPKELRFQTTLLVECELPEFGDNRTESSCDREPALTQTSSNVRRCDDNANELFAGDVSGLRNEATLCTNVVNKENEVSGSKVYKPEARNSNIAYYIDLHGHASKRGCFIYANHFENCDEQIEALLFPKLMSINSQNFDFEACNFSLKNMMFKDKRDGLSKEGSGRVAIYKTIGLIHSYTLECNYNTGRFANPLPAANENDGRATPPMLSSFPPKYTPEVYAQVGRALAVSALDMAEANPWSRVPASDFHTMKGVRQWLSVYIRSTRNPIPISKKNGKSKSKEDMPARGTTMRKIDSTRNLRASQSTIEKKDIGLMEHKIKDLSFESTNRKESKILNDKKTVSKSMMEVRLSQVGNKAPQEKKEKSEGLPFLGLQQKPIEVIAIKEKTSTVSQTHGKKETVAKYRLQALPKNVNRPIRKGFSKSIKPLEDGNLKKKQLRCEKTRS